MELTATLSPYIHVSHTERDGNSTKFQYKFPQVILNFFFFGQDVVNTYNNTFKITD